MTNLTILGDSISLPFNFLAFDELKTISKMPGHMNNIAF